MADDRRIGEVTFVVTDTETTGLDPRRHRIIEIGAVKVQGGRHGDSFESLVNPGRHVPRQITRLTGITTPSVHHAPSTGRVLSSYAEFLSDGVFVAHNASFDASFVNAECRRIGNSLRVGPTLCTKRLARRLLPALPGHSLRRLKDHYRIQAARSHRALDDAMATAEVFLKLLKALQNERSVMTVGELMAFQRSVSVYPDLPSHLRRVRKSILASLPKRPGVYFFRDRRGKLLYIGKAKSLRDRVRTYLSGAGFRDPRTRQLVRAIHHVDWQRTDSELEAVLLEAHLIKKLKPRFNRAEKVYRNRPFIRLASVADQAELAWTFQLAEDEAEYFGPLGRTADAERLIRLLNTLYPTRTRRADDSGTRRLRAILTGQDTRVFEHLKTEMRRAAERLQFERARWFRDELQFLERLAGPDGLASSVLDRNVVLIQPAEIQNRLEILVIRQGRLVESLGLDLPLSDSTLTATVKRAVEAGTTVSPIRGDRLETDLIRHVANWMYRTRDVCTMVPLETHIDSAALFQSIRDHIESAAQALSTGPTESATEEEKQAE